MGEGEEGKERGGEGESAERVEGEEVGVKTSKVEGSSMDSLSAAETVGV
jgi:hypothetical protein